MFSFFFSKLRENKKTAELIKTANLLFNSFEPYYMWDYIARWFEECCRQVIIFNLCMCKVEVTFCFIYFFLQGIQFHEIIQAVIISFLQSLELQYFGQFSSDVVVGLSNMSSHKLNVWVKSRDRINPPSVRGDSRVTSKLVFVLSGQYRVTHCTNCFW